MTLTNLTKVTATGISSTTNIEVNHGKLTGIVTATKFVGAISDATGGSSGLGTSISSDNTKPLNSIYYVNDTLHVTEHSMVDVPATSSNAYTQYSNIQVEDNVNLTVNDDCNFIPDVLSLFP